MRRFARNLAVRCGAIALSAALTACKTNPNSSGATQPQPSTGITAPPYSSIAKAQSDRVAMLQKLYANGSIDFRWKDDKGSHFETAHMDLWLSLPRHTSLRINKVGEAVIWLGSDDERYWFFDLLSKETSVRIGRHGEPVRAFDAATGLGLGPLALLDLLALSPLPEGRDDVPVAADSTRKAWVVAIDNRRMFFDQNTLLPSRVEIVDEHDQVKLSSSLREYRSVSQANMSPVVFPKLARLVDIFTADDDAHNGSVKLALDDMTGIVDDQPMDRVFDLNRLLASLKPQSVHDELPP